MGPLFVIVSESCAAEWITALSDPRVSVEPDIGAVGCDIFWPCALEDTRDAARHGASSLPCGPDPRGVCRPSRAVLSRAYSAGA
jgi:hypothetical protein